MPPRKRDNIMLAHPAELNRIQSLGYTFYVQPKLNGVRLYSQVTEEGIKLFSSTGLQKPFLEYIEEQLKELPPLSYDGELYFHGISWNAINSIASRTINKLEDKLEFHIFDIRSTEFPFHKRIRKLEDIRLSFPELKNIKFVKTNGANQENWRSFLTLYMQYGYEGIIFRSSTGTYETKRSKHLLKLKPTETDLYTIKGAVQGKGWCYDRLGAFIVEGKDGNQFEIGSGAALTAENRLLFWKMHLEDKLVGCLLKVKHETLKTANGFPVGSVALEVIPVSSKHLYSGHSDLREDV